MRSGKGNNAGLNLKFLRERGDLQGHKITQARRLSGPYFCIETKFYCRIPCDTVQNRPARSQILYHHARFVVVGLKLFFNRQETFGYPLASSKQMG